MGYVSKKLLNDLSGGIFGLISVILIILGEILAFLLFPGYTIFENMVSDLGAGPGGIFFNLSVFISGIIIIPYYVNLAKSFSGEIKENLRKFAISVAIISCITYSLLGIFPSIKENTIIFIIHGTLAAISIAAGLGYLILYSFLIFKAHNFSKIQAFHGLIISVFYSTFLFTWNPLIEWIMNIGILTWITANSIYMILNDY
jgi:hypothetical membrane protein